MYNFILLFVSMDSEATRSLSWVSFIGGGGGEEGGAFAHPWKLTAPPLESNHQSQGLFQGGCFCPPSPGLICPHWHLAFPISYMGLPPLGIAFAPSWNLLLCCYAENPEINLKCIHAHVKSFIRIGCQNWLLRSFLTYKLSPASHSMREESLPHHFLVLNNHSASHIFQ